MTNLDILQTVNTPSYVIDERKTSRKSRSFKNGYKR